MPRGRTPTLAISVQDQGALFAVRVKEDAEQDLSGLILGVRLGWALPDALEDLLLVLPQAKLDEAFPQFFAKIGSADVLPQSGHQLSERGRDNPPFRRSE